MVINIHAKHLKSFKEKLLGVAFCDKIRPVYFQTRWGIHTFFVRKEIDVFILDDNFIVHKIIRNIKPGKLVFWNPKYKNVLEVPPGEQQFLKISLGDRIEIVNDK